MVEDVARTVWITLQMGQPDEIHPEVVEKQRARYTNVYGQYLCSKRTVRVCSTEQSSG